MDKDEWIEVDIERHGKPKPSSIPDDVLDAIMAVHRTPNPNFKIGDKVIDCKGAEQTIISYITQDIVYLTDGSTCSIEQCLTKIEE